MANKPLTDIEIDDLKKLISDNMVDFHNFEYKSYIEDYKSYMGDVSDRLSKIESWQMNMSYPLAFMMVDTIYGTVFDFDYQLLLDNKKLEKACISAYDFKSYAKQALWMASKEWLITGTWMFRDYTYIEEWKYEAFGEKVNYKIKSPTMEYVSIFNVMYDRMKWLNDSSYKIVRQFLSDKEIESRIVSFIKDKESKEKTIQKIKSLKDGNAAFSMYNYEAIKWLLFSTQFIETYVDTKWKLAKWYSTDLESVISSNDLNYNRSNVNGIDGIMKASPYYNNFDYKYEVVEVRLHDMRHIFINGEFILSQEINPHIYNIVAIEFNRIPGSWKSIWVPRIIKQLASSSNGLMNMFLDSLKLSNTLIFKKKNGLPTKSEKIDIKSWQVLSGDIQRIDLWGWDFSWMNGIQALQWVAQSTLGVNQMIMGGDSRVQRIAGAFDFSISQYKARLTPFTDSIDIGMGIMIKGWLCQYLSMYSIDELKTEFDINIIKVKDKSTKLISDITVDWTSVSDILNEKNITFKFDSMHNLKKDANKKLAMDIFALAQQYNNSKVDWKLFVKLLAWDSTVKLEDVLGINEEYDNLDNIDDMDINNILDQVQKEDSITSDSYPQDSYQPKDQNQYNQYDQNPTYPAYNANKNYPKYPADNFSPVDNLASNLL